MEKKYLIDTNILIYHLNDDIPDYSLSIIKEIIKNSLNISVIAKCELLGWNGYDETSFLEAKRFLGYAQIFNINDQIVDSTIEIMRKWNLELPDAIIAATALLNNLILVTRNVKDFNKINNLEIYNPF